MVFAGGMHGFIWGCTWFYLGGVWFYSGGPTSAETHMWGKQLAAMLAIYTDRGVTPEVNLRECI